MSTQVSSLRNISGALFIIICLVKLVVWLCNPLLILAKRILFWVVSLAREGCAMSKCCWIIITSKGITRFVPFFVLNSFGSKWANDLRNVMIGLTAALADANNWSKKINSIHFEFNCQIKYLTWDMKQICKYQLPFICNTQTLRIKQAQLHLSNMYFS